MKAKIEAGFEFDILTKDEVKEILTDTMAQFWIGVRFLNRAAQGTVDGAGGLVIDDQAMGPAGGFLWAVTRVSVHGIVNTEEISVHRNVIAPTTFVGDIGTGPRFVTFDDKGLMLNPTERLVFAGTGLTAAAVITVNVQAVEVPITRAGMLA